jgi:hypothetical protein
MFLKFFPKVRTFQAFQALLVLQKVKSISFLAQKRIDGLQNSEHLKKIAD